jgi:dienelactone hydrolase
MFILLTSQLTRLGSVLFSSLLRSGGNGIMQYSYAGKDDVKVAVAFHGSLTSLPPVTTDINSYVLVLSGGDDFLHGNQTELEASLNEGNAEWEITRYSGVQHGYTVWGGGAYSLVADARSMESAETLIKERLASPQMMEPGTQTAGTSSATLFVSSVFSALVAVVAVALTL